MSGSDSLSDIEKKRYKRQMLLPGVGFAGQDKLKNARVLVVGIGGLGSQVLQCLTAMGIGTIGFLDFDLIEEENLSHQIFYGMDDIGKLKAVVTRKRLSGMNPLIHFKMLNLELNTENAGSIIPDYDIIIDATNKEEVNYLINDACIEYNKVMIFGGIRQLQGRISVFNYNNGPSYRCAYPEKDHSGTSQVKDNMGLPGILPGVTGYFLSNEVFNVITGHNEVLSGRIMIIDVFKYRNSFIEVTRNDANFIIPANKSDQT
jgi:sulfur-carrier protein adenylyltransferase/sulfurtransferase